MTRTALALCAALALFCGPVRSTSADSWRLGTASWYGTESCPKGPYRACLTATGESFNQWGMTAAVPYGWALGGTYTIQSVATGRTVVIRANDRCPSCGTLGRTFDLSRGAMVALGGSGVISIRWVPGGYAPPAFEEPAPVAPTLLATEWFWDTDCWVRKELWTGPVPVTYTPAC